MNRTLALAALLAASVPSAHAAPLTEARVNKIINEVAVVDPAGGARAATLHEVIKGETGVKTGIKSRSELLFQDQTLMRLGPETFFSFAPGTRDMTLKEGTMLLHVPKGLGGAKIRSAAVTAAITGTTIMLEHRPAKHLKVLVLEGSLRLSVKGRFGDSLLLTPGKMVIMPPDAKRIPDPITVDLAHVVKTSSLVQMSPNAKPLPSIGLIQREIDVQARATAAKRLIPTNLVIAGAGTNVAIAEDVPGANIARQPQEGRRNVAAIGPTVAGMHLTAAGNNAPVVSDPIVAAQVRHNENQVSNGGVGVSTGAGNGRGNQPAGVGNGNGNQSANGNGRGLGNGGPATFPPGNGNSANGNGRGR